MTFESTLTPKLIYVMRINDSAHAGCLKIGEASIPNGCNVFDLQPNSKVLNQAARERIDSYTKTAGINYELIHTETTIYLSGRKVKSFNDKEVHDVLIRSGIHRHKGANFGTEWFETDLETVKNAIRAVREGRKSLLNTETSQGRSPIVLRNEQKEAVAKTKERFKKGNQMLWNAKMRFGKTVSALQTIRELGFRRTLILTHRPVVDDGWYVDFQKIFYDRDDFRYGSRNRGDGLKSLEAAVRADSSMHYVYFVSMQDLRGSEAVGGKFDKNHEIFSTQWDFIIIDEAHEGTQTELGQSVIKELKKPKTKVLSLSGTPFNLLENDQFKEEEIFTWDYVMEQRAKADWDKTHFGDPNPYIGLPAMNIYTYDLGRLLHDYADVDVAFNFREFFRVNESGRFVHEKDVAAFLNLLCKDDEQSAYPFSYDKYRDTFRHTLWMVPGVKAALALQRMLEAHPVFQHFTVVNVAGDGDPTEEENAEALQLLRSKIGDDPDKTRTITLSCGRLTTGVTVPEWTAVLMLSGSFNTAAASYMQTIFRVQSPATINGRVKEQCYVFDFAPDRTLKVLAETAKISTRAGKTTDSDRQAMSEFLNFCPVISCDGSQMREKMSVDTLLRQLKKVYIERVVNSGFEDSYLYNDELSKLSEIDIQDFNRLRSSLSTKSSNTRNSIEINNQGLTKEEYEEKERLGKKKKKKQELTEEEKRRLEELKKKYEIKRSAISILRGISIRLPLLIYGAELKDNEKITIDNFTSLFKNDIESWNEFMPQIKFEETDSSGRVRKRERTLTIEEFNRFKKYYDPDVFAAAAERIRNLAHSADHLSIEQRIERISQLFTTFRNPDVETVLTPWRVVNMHISDALGGYCFLDKDFKETIAEPRFVDRGKVTAEVFNPDTRILEINSKTGLYPLYMAYSTYRARLKELTSSPQSIEEEWEVWNKVIAENIFVVCKTPMAKSITKRTLIGFRKVRTNMYAPKDLFNKIKNQPELFIKKVHDLVGENVNINAIVGNPPYQEEGISSRKAPIYHLFYDVAFKLAPKVTLITPGRFLFRAGQTPKEWMDRILNDEHFKVVRYVKKSTDIFPNVDIKGGVAITYRNENQNFGVIGNYSEYEELRSIIQKVKEHQSSHEGAFADLISSQGIYKFSDTAFEEHPEIYNVQGTGTASKITSNAFEHLPLVFLDTEPETPTDYIQIYGRSNNKRVYRWIDKRYVLPTDNYLETYNVFVPEANGSGAIGEVLSTPVIGVPVIGVPVIGHTDTFLSIGKFADAQEAERCLIYVKAKFTRCMLGTLKATQHNPRDTWANVPLQDFTDASDIDWSQPVEGIDRQLYRKYGLTDDEIAFIESMIKPM